MIKLFVYYVFPILVFFITLYHNSVSKFIRFINTNNFQTKNPVQSNFNWIQWFVGFTDGEGNFHISLDSNKSLVRFRFKIALHVDDLAVLQNIQSKLGIGSARLESDGKTAVFVVQDLKQIKNVIIPIFDNNNLLTAKVLDYLSFKEAIAIKGDENKLSDDQFNKIKSIKAPAALYKERRRGKKSGRLSRPGPGKYSFKKN